MKGFSKVFFVILLVLSLYFSIWATLLILLVGVAGFNQKWVEKRKKELILLVLATLFCLIIILIVSVLFRPDWRWAHWHDTNTQFDAELGWAPIQNRELFNGSISVMKTNQLGFRSDEVNWSREHILVVGDSVAWGYGIADNLTIAHFLGESLSEYQVLNLGVSGYSIDQYYLSLKRNINYTNPKYIFVIICAENDIQGTLVNNANGKSKPLFRWQDEKLTLTNTPVNKNSCFNLWATSWFLINLESRYDWAKGIKGRLCKEEKVNNDEGRQIIPNLLLKINQLGAEHNASVFFLISPHYEDFPSGNVKVAYFEEVLNEAKLPYINLYKVIAKNTSPETIRLFYIKGDWGHYSDLGGYYVAQVMKEVIAKWENRTVKK